MELNEIDWWPEVDRSNVNTSATNSPTDLDPLCFSVRLSGWGMPYMWPKHVDDWRWSKGFEAFFEIFKANEWQLLSFWLTSMAKFKPISWRDLRGHVLFWRSGSPQRLVLEPSLRFQNLGNLEEKLWRATNQPTKILHEFYLWILPNSLICFV